MSNKKFWLGFGGVTIQVWDDKDKRWTGVALPDSHGKIIFEPVYRYQTENIDYEIINKLAGWRVRIEVRNIFNDGSDAEANRLKGLLNVINWENTKRFKDIRICPKFIEGKLEWQQHWFSKMKLLSSISITEPERFDCYQEFQPVTFISKKLLKPDELTNIFDAEERERVKRRVDIRSSSDLRANDVQTKTLTLTIEGAGEIEVNGQSYVTGETTFNRKKGTTLILTVTAGTLVEWNGDASGQESQIEVKLTDDKHIIAIFEE